MKIQSSLYPRFPLVHDKCQGHKKPFSSLHIGLRDAFQVSWANHYFLRKKDFERSETGAKPLVRGQEQNPLKLNVFQ